MPDAKKPYHAGESSTASDRWLRFGPFTLDCRSGELSDAGGPVRMRPQATRALLLLVGRPGELVTRDELRYALWKDTSVDWVSGLHQVMREVRQSLHDDASHPLYIETVPRRGYRFRAVVSPLSVPVGRSPGESNRPWRQAGFFMVGVLATVVSLAMAVLVACLLIAS